MDENTKEAMSKKPKKNWIDSSVDFLFSNDERKWLLLITLFGFILRLINVNNRMVYGDPPHFLVNAVNFLNSDLLVLWDQSTFLWHALTDIFYHIFGITQFAGRFSSLLFGTLTILLIYLFVKEFSGNKKVALISSLIYAFAPAFIFNAADEHDISVLFFMMTTFYYLIKGIKRDSKKYLIYSGILFGVTCMWKAYTPIFMIPYLGIVFYYYKTKRFDLKKHYKTFIWIFLIIFLLVTPTVVYNYSNYKHNDLPTFFFAKFFSFLKTPTVQEMYGWVSAGELNNQGYSLYDLLIDGSGNTATGNQKLPVFLFGFKSSIFPNGFTFTILLILSVVFLLFKLKDRFIKDYLIFFALYFFIPYSLLVESNNIPKHFVQFLAFGIPIMAYAVYEIYLKINSLTPKTIDLLKKKIVMVFIILLLFEFFVILSLSFGGNHELLFDSNPEGQFIKYKEANIPVQSVVFYDDRIYNSLVMWLLNDRLFVPLSAFSEFMKYNQQSSNTQTVPVFILECGVKECGWATNPELTNFSENFFSQVNSQSIPVVFTAKEQTKNKEYYNPLISPSLNESNYFIVYKTSMNLDLSIAKQIKLQQNSFMYPIAYENKAQQAFKKFIYIPEGIFEIIINKVAWLMFYLNILLCFLTILLVVYELYKDD